MRTSLRTLIALVGGAVALAVHRKANGLEPMQATRAEAHYSEVKYGTDSLEHRHDCQHQFAFTVTYRAPVLILYHEPLDKVALPCFRGAAPVVIVIFGQDTHVVAPRRPGNCHLPPR